MYSVAIIDDELWSREVVKSLGDWERLNLHIIGEADDGNAGLRMLEQLQPHIVVTDMRMPGKDGVELLQAMNENHPAIKIIVMSGYDDVMYLKQAIRSRAIEYLLKPINPEELNAALEQSVNQLRQEDIVLSYQTAEAPLFSDRVMLDNYLKIRKRLYGYLLELNKEGVRESFLQLAHDIQAEMTHTIDSGIATKIGIDFLLMLEQFTVEQGTVLEHLYTEDDKVMAPLRWGTIQETIERMIGLFEETIEAVLTIRQHRNRLDIAEVEAYIDRHYQELISLDSIAQHFFISKEHLSRSFKSSTGENITEYILRRRMEKAKTLILEQRLSIKHAAHMVGYEDLSYFYRVFKKYFNMTPGELRQQK